MLPYVASLLGVTLLGETVEARNHSGDHVSPYYDDSRAKNNYRNNI